ncbi:unnamed protein product, partial [Allacma fusca]
GTFVQEASSLPTLVLAKFTRNGEGYLRQNSTPRALLTDGYNISDYNSYLRKEFPFNLTELQHDVFTPFNELSYPKKFTVRSDPATFGQIISVDGEHFDDPSNGCNVVPPTDGSIFPSNITKDTILSFYSEDLCSVVPLVFKEATTYKGISAFKFVLAQDALDIAACDCSANNDKSCLPSGAIDVKTCQQNLPYIASLPHFLDADPKYTQNVSGLFPNDTLHRSHFIIEPVTGSVLESSLKFQLNVNLLKFKYEDIIWDDVSIQDTVFPLFWTEKKYNVAEGNVPEIRRYLEEMTGATSINQEDNAARKFEHGL